jgi:autotransporter-associated beta strand protein
LAVTLDAPVTIGTLLLGNTGSAVPGYTISGSGANSLTFDNSGTAAQITVTSGTHDIAAPLALASDLIVSPSATTALRIDGNIGEVGGAHRALRLADAGTLILSGTDNTFLGGVTVTEGTLILTNSGALADGSSLTVGDATLFAPVIPDLAASGITSSSVPEPSTLALFTAAVCGAAVYHRLRSRRKK